MMPRHTSGTLGAFSITDRMKILVMGAGAIGAFYGAWLQRAGDEVYFCARGEHLRALQEHGLEVTSIDERMHAGGIEREFHLPVKASSDPREFAPYELILFCVKSQDTISAAKQVVGCLADDGVMLTLQNGVENEALLCEVFPREQVMGGNARVGAEITAPGQASAHGRRKCRDRRARRPQDAARRAYRGEFSPRRRAGRADRRSAHHPMAQADGQQRHQHGVHTRPLLGRRRDRGSGGRRVGAAVLHRDGEGRDAPKVRSSPRRRQTFSFGE